MENVEIKASISYHYNFEVVESSDELDEHDFAVLSRDEALRQARDMIFEDVSEMVIRYPNELAESIDLEFVEGRT